MIRDYDGYVYLREWSGGILGGGFEPHSKPCFQTGIPEKFEFQLLEEDWDHFRKFNLARLLDFLTYLFNYSLRELISGWFAISHSASISMTNQY